MPLYSIVNSRDMRYHQLLVFIPIIAITLFCFSYISMRPQAHKATHAAARIISSTKNQTSSNLPPVSLNQLPKLDVVPAPSTMADGSQVQSSASASATLQSAQSMNLSIHYRNQPTGHGKH